MHRCGAPKLGALLSSVADVASQIPRKGTVVSGQDQRILLGRITGAQGLKGEIVVASYAADPGDIASYGPLSDADGRHTFSLSVVRVADKGVIARVEGVADRTAAEKLKGTELWIDRSLLPAADEREYYHADLIGLKAVAPDGRPIGEIVAVENFGAGDLLDIRLDGSPKTELVPFTDACVPEIDFAGRRVVVRFPETTGDADPNDDDDAE